MYLVILEKIESSTLNSLGCIVRLEKKNGNSGKNLEKLKAVDKLRSFILEKLFLPKGKRIWSSVLEEGNIKQQKN